MPITIDALQDSLTVATSAAITDLSDVLARGHLKEHPDLVSLRLGLIANMVDRLRAAIASERSTGQWGPLPDAEIVADHQEQVAEYAGHTCNCPHCLHGGQA